MNNVQLEKIRVDGADIVHRNFGGKGDEFNPEGSRNFSVILDEILAEYFEAQGVRVGHFQEKRYMRISISTRESDGFPDITLVDNDDYYIAIEKERAHILDSLEIITADILLCPWLWEVGGRSGVKLTLVEMRVNPLIREH